MGSVPGLTSDWFSSEMNAGEFFSVQFPCQVAPFDGDSVPNYLPALPVLVPFRIFSATLTPTSSHFRRKSLDALKDLKMKLYLIRLILLCSKGSDLYRKFTRELILNLSDRIFSKCSRMRFESLSFQFPLLPHSTSC